MRAKIPILFLALAPSIVTAQVNYAISGNTAYVASSPNASGDITIASTYDGYPVTTIGYAAFSGASLTGVTIPNTVTNIAGYAFQDCFSLTSVTIPASVVSIGDAAFEDCKLTSIAIPAGVISIGEQAFYGYVTSITVAAQNPSFSSLNGVLFNKNQTTLVEFPNYFATTYAIPNGVTSIGDYAFYGCVSLTSVIIPNSVTNIGEQAFALCFGMQGISIPDSVTIIGHEAFFDCSGLTNVIIPSSVTNMGDGPFVACTSLTNITVLAGNRAYISTNSVLFDINQAVLIQYPAGNNRSSYNIPNNVTNISSQAFANCVNLASVIIPDTVISVADGAFGSCVDLTNITIPSNVASIGDLAFANCDNLTNITFLGNAPALGGDVFWDVPGTVYYYSGTTGWSAVYGGLPTVELSVTPSSEFTYTTNNGVITITGYIGSPTSITIPASIDSYPVTSISAFAFLYDSLTSVTIPNTVTNIQAAAFAACGSLTNIAVDAANSYYGSVNGVLFNKAQTTLIEFAGGLGSYTIPNSVTSIGPRAFADCFSLTNVTIPDSVTNIEAEAFYECHNLTSVMIPDGLIIIGLFTFQDCYSLTSVTIPSSVTSIGMGAFIGCSSVTNITIPGSVTSIGAEAFDSCYSLTSITIPGSITNIGDQAFEDCHSLTNITFLGNAPAFGGSYVFYNVSGSIYFYSGTTGWAATYGGLPAIMLNPSLRISEQGWQGNGFSFTVAGYVTNQIIIVEASTDLANWQPIQTNTSGLPFNFTDSKWTNYQYRFYTASTPINSNPISVNFVGGSGNGSATPLSSGQIAGVITVSNWNNVAQIAASGTASGLLDSSGNPTPASVTWSADDLWSSPISEVNANYQLMKGYLDNPEDDISVSVSGLPHNANDVYVYFNDDNDTGGTAASYTIGSNRIYGYDAGRFAGTFILASGTNAADPNAVGNYVVFKNVRGTSFTLTAHPEDAVHRSPVNGIQIVPSAP